MFADPIRTKSVGGRTWFGVFLLFSIAVSTCTSERYARETRDLEKQQLEVAKKQYQLDSLRFEHLKTHQK